MSQKLAFKQENLHFNKIFLSIKKKSFFNKNKLKKMSKKPRIQNKNLDLKNE